MRGARELGGLRYVHGRVYELRDGPSPVVLQPVLLEDGLAAALDQLLGLTDCLRWVLLAGIEERLDLLPHDKN